MSELLPCPFCGGEAETWDNGALWHVICKSKDCAAMSSQCFTEAEAIAAWNTRAAYEMDGWFYLPKPKQQLFSYTTGFSFDDLSLKSTGTVDVYALTSAVQKWQEEALNAQIIERICEVFKPERTCHDVKPSLPFFKCDSCGMEDMGGTELWIQDGFYRSQKPNYCPNCGAKVVD